MSFTRYIQCGFEFRDVNELEPNVSYGTSGGLISTSAGDINTGSAAMDIGGGAYARGKAIPGTSTLTIRSGAYFSTVGTNSGKEGCLFIVTGSNTIVVTYDTDDNLIRLRIAGTIVDSVVLTSTEFATTDVYHNIGIYVYRDSSVGRIGFYVGGNLVLEYDGNTGTYTNGVYCGGSYDSSSFHTNTFLDDFYIDYSTTLESETAPPNLLFAAIRPTGDGSPIDWSTFGSASHYANIDDTTPNSDTDYNYATVADVVDKYTLGNYSVPSGFSIAAVIPTVYAKKTSAVTDPTLVIGLNENSTDDYASGHSLTTTYAYYNDRFTLAPDNDSWDDTNIDDTSLLLKTGGTF